MSAFEDDTAVVPAGDGRYTASLSRDWWVVNGPNGGYLAAVVLRALAAAVGDDTRAPRSLTVHYARPPAEGEVEIATTLERKGRSLSTMSARVEQDGRVIALALAAFSQPRDSVAFCDISMPQVPGPEHVVPSRPPAGAPPIASRWESRWTLGRPPAPDSPPGARALAGGWIRLHEPHVVDAPVAAAITDAWLPPLFARLREPLAVPTVDLTVHFRSALPHPGLTPDDFVLAVFRTNVGAEGFIEEDGEVWAPDGTLLAQSRQLAVVLPFS